MTMTAAERGALGGRKRSTQLSPQRRSEIARIAAFAKANKRKREKLRAELDASVEILVAYADELTPEQVTALRTALLAELRRRSGNSP